MRKAVFFSVFFILFVTFVLLQIFNIDSAFAQSKNDINYDFDKSSASSFILVESTTGTIVLEKNSEKKLPIASMTKLMTLKIVLDHINAGKLSLEDKFKISENAASQTGSEAFLDKNQEYSVDDLIRATIIVSANDAAVALAEIVSGSVENFVKLMNDTAKEIGMYNTNFANPTGLPAPGHFSTAKDMAIISQYCIDNLTFKQYSRTNIDELVHPSGRKTSLINTCRKINKYAGFEGGKTGHTNEAGYCFASAARRGDMRFVAVVMGVESSEERFNLTERMFDYGFDNFRILNVVGVNKPIISCDLSFGVDNKIDLYAKNSFSVFLKKNEKYDYKKETQIFDLKLPISAEDCVGKIKIICNGDIVFETDLIAKRDYEHIGIKKLFFDLIKSF